MYLHTLKHELHLTMLKIYLHTKSELSRSRLSNDIAYVLQQTDTHSTALAGRKLERKQRQILFISSSE